MEVLCDNSHVDVVLSDADIAFTLNGIIETHKEHPFRKIFQYKQEQFLGQIRIADVTEFMDSLETIQSCRYVDRDKPEKLGAEESVTGKERESFAYRGGQYTKVNFLLDGTFGVASS